MANLITNVQDFFTALFSTAEGSEGIVTQFFTWVTSAEILPYFAVGICVSLVLLSIRIVRGLIWGN